MYHNGGTKRQTFELGCTSTRLSQIQDICLRLEDWKQRKGNSSARYVLYKYDFICVQELARDKVPSDRVKSGNSLKSCKRATVFPTSACRTPNYFTVYHTVHCNLTKDSSASLTVQFHV